MQRVGQLLPGVIVSGAGHGDDPSSKEVSHQAHHARRFSLPILSSTYEGYATVHEHCCIPQLKLRLPCHTIHGGVWYLDVDRRSCVRRPPRVVPENAFRKFCPGSRARSTATVPCSESGRSHLWSCTLPCGPLSPYLRGVGPNGVAAIFDNARLAAAASALYIA